MKSKINKATMALILALMSMSALSSSTTITDPGLYEKSFNLNARWWLRLDNWVFNPLPKSSVVYELLNIPTNTTVTAQLGACAAASPSPSNPVLKKISNTKYRVTINVGKSNNNDNWIWSSCIVRFSLSGPNPVKPNVRVTVERPVKSTGEIAGGNRVCTLRVNSGSYTLYEIGSTCEQQRWPEIVSDVVHNPNGDTIAVRQPVSLTANFVDSVNLKQGENAELGSVKGQGKAQWKWSSSLNGISVKQIHGTSEQNINSGTWYDYGDGDKLRLYTEAKSTEYGVRQGILTIDMQVP